MDHAMNSVKSRTKLPALHRGFSFSSIIGMIKSLTRHVLIMRKGSMRPITRNQNNGLNRKQFVQSSSIHEESLIVSLRQAE